MLLLCVCRDIEHLGIEVWRALKKLELLHREQLFMPLSHSPNFPRAHDLNTRMLTHELIVK